MEKWHQHARELGRKLLLLLFVYEVCRLLFYLFNQHHFQELGIGELLYIFVVSVKFDLSVLVLLNSLFILLWLLPLPFRYKKGYQLFLKWLFIIPNSIGILANCVDLVYFPFTLKRTTADVFHFFGGEIGNDLFELIPTFFTDYWYIFLIWLGLSYLLISFYGKVATIIPTWSKKDFLIQTAVFIAGIPLALLIYRGGFQLKPINAVDAAQYTSSQNVPLVISTPFSILKTLDLKTIEPHNYYANEPDLIKHYTPIHAAESKEFKKMNVFLIILESFSKEYIGAINHRQKGFTPFLDSLMSESLVFPNAFSNGKKSIEGVPAIIASIPTWMDEAYITSPYGSNNMNSLASTLKSEGYRTAFFHGGTNGTMGFDAFARLAGYEQYYGRKEYNDESDYDGNWGIWDEEFMQYVAKRSNEMPQPFFSTLFTLSSHHPFEVPKKYEGKFKEGDLPILKSVAYTDYSLRRFFETAKQMPWYNNTLFVLCADHTGISGDAFYSNLIGSHAIPIVYYKANSDLKGIDSTVTQQLDIMPTVLNYLGYPKKYFAFGHNSLDSLKKQPSLTYNNNFYQLIEGSYVLEFDGTNSLALYNYQKDSTLKKDLRATEKQMLRKMEDKVKAMIQTYEQSLINNKMTTN